VFGGRVSLAANDAPSAAARNHFHRHVRAMRRPSTRASLSRLPMLLMLLQLRRKVRRGIRRCLSARESLQETAQRR